MICQANEKHQILLAVALARHQLGSGKYFSIENLASSRIWLVKDVLELMQGSRVIVMTGHGCVWGLTGRGGSLLKKTWRFITNDPVLAWILSQKCPGESAWHVHEVCQGSLTTASHNYPVPMARAILKRVRDLVKHHGDVSRFWPDDNPSKFCWSLSCSPDDWEPAGFIDSPLEFEVFYLDVTRDETCWRGVAAQAETWLGSSTDKSRMIEHSTELFAAIQSLCPWDIARI